MSLARLAFPDRRAIGLLVAAETEDVLPELERAAATQGQNLLVERIEAGQDVGRATERLAQQSDLLLAWPDARVHNRFTVQPLLLVTYRARVPVIGYSDAYLKAGAVLALYSTPEQLAEQAVDSLLALRLGRTLPGIQWPRQFTVGVNFSVARSLEITLPSASQLQQRLKESGS